MSNFLVRKETYEFVGSILLSVQKSTNDDYYSTKTYLENKDIKDIISTFITFNICAVAYEDSLTQSFQELSDLYKLDLSLVHLTKSRVMQTIKHLSCIDYQCLEICNVFPKVYENIEKLEHLLSYDLITSQREYHSAKWG